MAPFARIFKRAEDRPFGDKFIFEVTIMPINKQQEGKPKLVLLGAIAGDIIGVPYEYKNHKSMEFDLFTQHSHFSDDTVLTVAVAEAILKDGDYSAAIRCYGQRFPHADYGGLFQNWLLSENTKPYNSFGNGSAMRVSPVGWAFDSVEEVLREAEYSAAVTHNHPEGIKGAQAVALAIYLARSGADKPEIRREIQARFEYNLDRPLDEIRPTYEWDVTCQGSVPESIIAFLESDNFEDAIRKSISLGGDADTMAAITGSIAEAFYAGVPEEIIEEVRLRLPEDFWKVIEAFNKNLQDNLP
jgi:ADP-ribosylglycohydrolase